ncbi:MAG: selenocysteine-specific translation elongation factor [candidate division WOR-3 bacterium]|jgi:selenocysteine-specific elongation factor
MARHFVIGTAGHIDHGKSAIVKALTGTDPDRLKEEQERGMTTDLGFAFLGDEITIIDVPGHERFVRHMLAGASTIDMVMLVVAADDGVMPQTREHFEICRLLGIKRGLIVINKVDLVDAEMIGIVKEDVKDLVRGSFLDGAPVLEVSARTGKGIDELKQAIRELTSTVERRPDRGVFRLPIDRCFTIKGFGIVVAGTVLSGSCRVGERLEILPEGINVRVRGIQRHNRAVDSAGAGERAALNLQGVQLEQIHRGQVLVTPGYYQPTSFIQGTLYLLKDAPAELKNMTRVHLHIGTAEVMCRVCLLDKKELVPGEEGLVQLRTEEPVVCEWNDRFVLRHFAPLVTIGGGVVLETGGSKLRRFDDVTINRLQQLRSGEKGTVLEQFLLKSGFDIKTLNGIARALAITDEDAVQMSEWLVQTGKAEIIEDEGKKYLIHKEVYRAAAANVLAVLSDFHQQNPLRMGIKQSELRAKAGNLPAALFALILSRLAGSGAIVIMGEKVRAPEHTVRLKPEEQVVFDRVLEVLKKARWAPPALEVLFSGVDRKLSERVKIALVESGAVIDIGEGIYMHAQAVAEAKNLLLQMLAERKELAATDFRQALGTTRKFAIPLLNYFDSIGLTQRRGDVRVLKSSGCSTEGC